MSELQKVMYQTAPWPDELEELVRTFRYKPGWTFRLVSDLARDFEPEDTERERCIGRGTTLVITSLTYNSYGNLYGRPAAGLPGPALQDRAGRHLRPPLMAPVAARHVHRGRDPRGLRVRPLRQGGSRRRHRVRTALGPHHGPGENPYVIFELGSDSDVRTSFRGELKSTT